MTRKSITIFCSALLISLFALAASQSKDNPKSSAQKSVPWAIQVERVDSSTVSLPPEFSAATYEDLIDQITRSGKFERVFRSGDRQAESVPNLLVLKTNVEKFQQGSETTRAVTTVGGFTKIVVHMQLAAKDGRKLADKQVEGKIRFFGENLKATQDLTKSIVKVLQQTSFTQ